MTQQITVGIKHYIFTCLSNSFFLAPISLVFSYLESRLNHILIVEEFLAGHHLTWLRYTVEDFLSLGLHVSLAIDNRPDALQQIKTALAPFGSELSLFNLYDNNSFRCGNLLKTIVHVMGESGAQEVFLNNFDEIASSILRKSALGLNPPANLQGKLNGIYFRPRFLDKNHFSVNNWFKEIGFRHLCQKRWINDIFMLDENLVALAKKKYNGCRFHFLPDTWHGDLRQDILLARARLNLPPEKHIVLNFGIGDRRKGLHLVVDALLRLPQSSSLYLLCAGKVSEDKTIQQGLETLQKQGRAKVINRYVSDEEEMLCFSACDTVLLPYVNHFGSSGVLSRGAAAQKIIVASDEGLVGNRVKENGLGLLFQSGSVDSLTKCLEKLENLAPEIKKQIAEAAGLFAISCDRNAFRAALKNMLCCRS